jgi:hypothetical protein
VQLLSWRFTHIGLTNILIVLNGSDYNGLLALLALLGKILQNIFRSSGAGVTSHASVARRHALCAQALCGPARMCSNVKPDIFGRKSL